MSPPPEIRNEEVGDADAIDALVERAFGPGRYAKAAERLRENNAHRADLSFTAWRDGRLAGSVRLWPAHVGERKLVFLGPIAVDPDERNRGLGQALVERACEAAAAAGFGAVLLVGDAPWFERTGFSQAAGVEMPGPVDRRRVLVRELVPGAAEGLGGLAKPGPVPKL